MRRAGAGCGSSTVGRKARRGESVWSTPASTASRRSSPRIAAAQDRCGCRWSAPSRSERAGRGGPRDRAPAARRCGVRRLAHSKAPGRLERVGERNGAPIFVDYAHKPDALEKVLKALRPYARGRLVVVFGGGGDRDRGKRPLMGEIAARGRRVIVTDDNPRSEDPAAIRAAIMAARRARIEIGDRARGDPRRGRRAGAGRRAGRRRQGPRDRPDRRRRTLPFADHEAVARRACGEGRMSASRSGPSRAMAARCAPRPTARWPDGVTGVSIDTRTLQPGDFLRHRGDARRPDSSPRRSKAARRGRGRARAARSSRPMRRCWSSTSARRPCASSARAAAGAAHGAGGRA